MWKIVLERSWLCVDYGSEDSTAAAWEQAGDGGDRGDGRARTPGPS